MKNLNLIIVVFIFLTGTLRAQNGYYDAPYVRYEADLGTLTNATVTPRTYKQSDLQSEASGQVCVSLFNAGASVSWSVTGEGDGLVVRYSVPDGQSGVLEVFADNVSVGTLTLTTTYSWEYLSSNGNPNNAGVVNTNPRMRFDEVRMLLPSKIAAGGNLKLVNQSGNISIDFAELESVPVAITAASGDVTYSGNGSNLQTFINANGGKIIYLPAGVYNVNRELYFGVANTVLKGAGMWYTEINFTNNAAGMGGLRANADNVSYSGLYLSTVRNSRSNSYKAINGVYTNGATITNIWAEHFECGAWIGQYNSGGPSVTNGFTLSGCRFRNNYADGINLCKGTANAIVEHTSFRNNGDDDMAIWSSDGLECWNNTYRYNTSENCWRASGCAIYGGMNNKAHHLLIQDNLEVGLRVNNSFSGIGFNDNGTHEFSDITILRCGTFNDLFNNPVGAIDIACTNIAGTRIKNVKFSNINIVDSKNDAIYIYKKNGDGFYNLVFENITVNGTGKEYPNNNAKSLNWGRGYGVLIVGFPAGNATYCNMNYSNRGGNSTSDLNTTQLGTLTWTNAGCGTNILSPLNGALFGECDPKVTITAEASTDYGPVDSVEFFVDGIKIGKDNTSPYSFDWTNLLPGTHQVSAKSHQTSGGSIVSPSQDFSIVYYKGLLPTATAPTIDGTIESLWSNYTSTSLDKVSVGTISSPEDLSASFKISYDEDNLYILVEVTDDELKNDGGNNYDNDAIEIFIDMGNDKNIVYGTDDYTYNFVYNDATVYETQHNAINGVTFAQGAKSGGYIMEISIPWNTIGAAPGSKEMIGFDIHVDDDDGLGSTRDAKKTWTDCSDIAWNNPSALGTIQESGCTSSAEIPGILNFLAIDDNGNAFLNWQAYYKQNISVFEVQRDATESGTFQTISTVSAAGASGTLLSKSYTNTNVPSGLLTYRISQLDVKGCRIFSDNKSLTLTTTGISDGFGEYSKFNFYPNPFQNTAELRINSENTDDYSITIKDMNGKLISSRTVAGGASYVIGNTLQPGMYILEVTEGKKVQSIKLIKL